MNLCGRSARWKQTIMKSSILIAASASIPLALGIDYLVFTF